MGPADVSGRNAAPPTAQRAYCAQKAFLTCPKNVAAMFLRVLREYLQAHVIAVFFPNSEGRGTCSQSHDLRVSEDPH
jgi:hypothetical protein